MHTGDRPWEALGGTKRKARPPEGGAPFECFTTVRTYRRLSAAAYGSGQPWPVPFSTRRGTLAGTVTKLWALIAVSAIVLLPEKQRPVAVLQGGELAPVQSASTAHVPGRPMHVDSVCSSALRFGVAKPITSGAGVGWNELNHSLRAIGYTGVPPV